MPGQPDSQADVARSLKKASHLRGHIGRFEPHVVAGMVQQVTVGEICDAEAILDACLILK
jgi:hypothetical protein